MSFLPADTLFLYMEIATALSLGVLVALISTSLWRRFRHRTERVSLEDRKSEFLALAAHYFLTPLSIVRGNISELLDPEAAALDKAATKAHYLTIDAQTNLLLRLIENISIIAAIDSKQLRVVLSPANIVDVLDDCIAEIHSEAIQKNISLQFERPDHLRIEQVSLDVEKFHLAIVNVLSNAIKFTSPNGSVVIHLVEQPKGYVITISDSGIGIVGSEIPQLFTRFHRGTSYLNMDYEGIGIGLYLTKYLIEANGGSISIASQHKQGTQVTILLAAER